MCGIGYSCCNKNDKLGKIFHGKEIENFEVMQLRNCDVHYVKLYNQIKINYQDLQANGIQCLDEKKIFAFAFLGKNWQKNESKEADLEDDNFQGKIIFKCGDAIEKIEFEINKCGIKKHIFSFKNPIIVKAGHFLQIEFKNCEGKTFCLESSQQVFAGTDGSKFVQSNSMNNVIGYLYYL